jgi:hypothetical protein
MSIKIIFIKITDINKLPAFQTNSLPRGGDTPPGKPEPEPPNGPGLSLKKAQTVLMRGWFLDGGHDTHLVEAQIQDLLKVRARCIRRYNTFSLIPSVYPPLSVFFSHLSLSFCYISRLSLYLPDGVRSN